MTFVAMWIRIPQREVAIFGGKRGDNAMEAKSLGRMWQCGADVGLAYSQLSDWTRVPWALRSY